MIKCVRVTAATVLLRVSHFSVVSGVVLVRFSVNQIITEGDALFQEKHLDGTNRNYPIYHSAVKVSLRYMHF